MFSSKKSLNKIESLQKGALRFALDDDTISYKLLLEKLGKPTMNLARERLLYIKVYKTLNSLTTCLMQELLKLRKTNKSFSNKYKLNLGIPVVSQVTCGTKSLRNFGPKICNFSKKHAKSGVSCDCGVCGVENIT